MIITTKTYKLKTPITHHCPLFIQIDEKHKPKIHKSTVVIHKYNYSKLCCIASTIY